MAAILAKSCEEADHLPEAEGMVKRRGRLSCGSHEKEVIHHIRSQGEGGAINPVCIQPKQGLGGTAPAGNCPSAFLHWTVPVIKM